MNHRNLTAILAITTLSLGTVLAGCGATDAARAEGTSSPTEAPVETTLAPETVTEVGTEEATEAETKAKKNYAAEYPAIAPKDLVLSVKDNVESPTFTIEEQVVLDQDGYKITILPNQAQGSDGSYAIGEYPWISYENNTDERVYVWIEDVDVNSLVLENNSTNTVDIQAGAEEIARCGDDYSEFLLEHGISEVQYMDMKFRICKADARETILTTERIRIETSLSDKETDPLVSEKAMIYDNEEIVGLRIYAAYQIEEDTGDLVITAMMDNRTDKKLNLQLNGFNEDIGKYFSCDYKLTHCVPGTYGYTTFRFAADSFTENAPEEFLYCFDVYSSDSYDVFTGCTVALGQ